MDGLETARRIRERLGNDVLILLLSACDWESVKEEAYSIGINGFLAKPIFQAEFLERLKYFIHDKKEEIQEQKLESPEILNGVRILTADVLKEDIRRCAGGYGCAYREACGTGGVFECM